MVDDIIVYRRKPTQAPSSSLSSRKRKLLKKQRCKIKTVLVAQQQGVVKGNSNLGIEKCELVDVDLSVGGSYRAEKVPFVRLRSESYGKPILGYPLEIGEITERVLPSKESVARMIFGDKQSRLHQLVWRTSKRSSVCYVTKEKSLLTKPSQLDRGKTASTQTCVPVEHIFSKISTLHEHV